MNNAGKNRRRQQRRLSWPTIIEIAIHIEPAKRPFNWVDRPILVAIEFLEVVVGQFRIVRIRNSGAKMISARVVTLGAFQHAVVHKIRSRLHNGFWYPLPMNVHTSRALRTCLLKLSQYRLGLLLNSLSLALRGSRYGTLLGMLDRRGLRLARLLLGRLGCDDDQSRLFCVYCRRTRLPKRGREYGHGTNRSEYNKF